MSTYRDSRGLLPNVRPKVDEVLARFSRSVITHVWGPGANPDHNNLRCCDFMVPSIAAGDQVANYLIANKGRLGVQGIIWNRRVMGFPENGGQYAGPSGTWRPYSGASPHTDHPHVQFSNSPIGGTPPVDDGGGGSTIIEITGYNDDARKLGIKAIGTVESRLTYDAINYNDPITVGVAQWYGPRAAAILQKMRDENPDDWAGVASSLATDLTRTADNWWTGRWLTRAEGQSLSPVLLANKPIQNAQFFADLDGYVATATRLGMNKDTNTLAVLFFASMEHQGPLYARQVLASVGPNANLDRIHAGAVAHPVLGRYRSRQDEVKRILLARDISGVDEPAESGGDPGDGGSGGDTPTAARVQYVQAWGDVVHLKMSDGTTAHAYPSGPNVFLVSGDATVSGEVKPPDNDNPDVPPSADVATKQQAIKTFLENHVGDFSYSQGPGRLNPSSSGYTDCSGLMYWAFNTVLGINLGTWTGTQKNAGTHIATGYGTGPDHGNTVDMLPADRMQVGDLIFYDWRGASNANYDHVEVWIGNGNVIGHGGPGNGPNVRNANTLHTNNNPLKWEVRRVVT